MRGGGGWREGVRRWGGGVRRGKVRGVVVGGLVQASSACWPPSYLYPRRRVWTGGEVGIGQGERGSIL